MTDAVKLVCFDCGQMNRVPTARLTQAPKCGTCGAGLMTGKVAELDPATLAKAKADELPVIVDFWAPWCGPCRAMAPEFAKAAEVMKGRVRFAKINTQDHPEVSQRHDIRGIPALLMFHKGREITRAAGARPAGDIIRLVQQATAAAGS